MRIYQWAAWLFPRSYRAKMLAVVFLCTTMPALVFAFWLLVNERAAPDELARAGVFTLIAVVVGGMLALMLLYKLLAPLRMAADALDDYYREQKLPWLPAVGDDDMARLLRGINRCLRGVDAGLRQMERQATEDTLTHALNRRGCERALADSMTLAGNGRTAFVLLVVDMDNLKTINDEHGHAAGDCALVALVNSAREACLGKHDWIGRWGGDEFLLGLHAPPDAAMARIRQWLASLETPVDRPFPVYVSAGCAHYQAGMDMAMLYRLADAAMYEAKFSGGHRLICHESRQRGSVRQEPQEPARASKPRPAATPVAAAVQGAVASVHR